MQKYRNYVLFTIALLVVLMLCSASFADELETAEEANIKSVVSDYFSLKHKIMSKLDNATLSSESSNVPSIISASYAEKFNTTIQMAVAHMNAQTVDLTYDRYNISFSYRSIDINGNNATVKVFVVEQIYFNADSSILSESGTTHTISLSKVGNSWYITNDSFALDGYGEAYELIKQQYLQDSVTKKLPMDEYIISKYRICIEGDIARRTQSIEANTNADNIVNDDAPQIALSSYTYDPTDAVTYARTYCRTSNPSPWSTLDLDCTNFTSIALNQDIPMDTTGNTWYWNSRSDRSASWASAQYFRQYIYNNNSSTSSNSGIYGKHDTYANCGLGDIIQYASDETDVWSTDNRPKSTHSSIVTKVSGGKLYVCMHSYGSADSDYRYDYLVDCMPYTYKHYLNIVRYYN